LHIDISLRRSSDAFDDEYIGRPYPVRGKPAPVLWLTQKIQTAKRIYASRDAFIFQSSLVLFGLLIDLTTLLAQDYFFKFLNPSL